MEGQNTIEEQPKKTNKFKHQSFGKKMGAMVLIAAVLQAIFIDVLVVFNYLDTKAIDLKTSLEVLFYNFLVASLVWGAVGSSNWTDVIKSKFGSSIK